MIFECHITGHVKDCHIFDLVARENHWKTSEIKRDPVLGDASHYYLTTHGADYVEVFTRMQHAAMEITSYGGTVVREKIELIMYDTKVKV